MPDGRMSTASRAMFATALVSGLLWGIGAATALAGGAMAFAMAQSDEPALRSVLESMGWTAMVASILAVFPIGPVAAVVGWQLYRRGIVATWAYAVAGALAALTAPLLILYVAIETARYPITTDAADIADPAAMVVAAAFPVLGAFGGFMAGRAIRRRASSLQGP